MRREAPAFAPPSASRRHKLLFLVTEDWYFWSHRLPLARAAKAANYDVIVATRVSDHADRIRAEGFKLVPIHLARRSTNPLRELGTLRELLRVYRQEKPDLVHHVAIKPVLYGSAIARLCGVGGTVNALAGMGYIFSSKAMSARVLRPFVVQAYRMALRGHASRLILQNPDDAALLQRLKIVGDSTRLSIIRGSGVETAAFPQRPEPEGVPLVVLPARMLWDKGVREFVDAARQLRRDGVRVRMALVGDGDAANPAAISERELLGWKEEGVIEWWGHRADMPHVLASANIVCLPSYREGLPKVLLEAMSCGRAIVTTDVPGCREVVRDGDNGLLVPVRTSEPLAKAIRQLVEDPALRTQMGASGRERVMNEFRVERVVEETLALYRELLAS
jgi:glycosyltransferase involved in cell wall biosynthesis